MALHTSENDLGIFIMISIFDLILIHNSGGDEEISQAVDLDVIRFLKLDDRHTIGNFDQGYPQCKHHFVSNAVERLGLGFVSGNLIMSAVFWEGDGSGDIRRSDDRRIVAMA